MTLKFITELCDFSYNLRSENVLLHNRMLLAPEYDSITFEVTPSSIYAIKDNSSYLLPNGQAVAPGMVGTNYVLKTLPGTLKVFGLDDNGAEIEITTVNIGAGTDPRVPMKVTSMLGALRGKVTLSGSNISALPLGYQQSRQLKSIMYV